MKFPWFIVGVTLLILLGGTVIVYEIMVRYAARRPEGPPVEIGTVFHVRGEVMVQGPRGEGRRATPGMKLDDLDLLESKGDGIASFVIHSPTEACGVYTVGPGKRISLWDLYREVRCTLEPTFAEEIGKIAREWTEASEYPPSVEGEVEVLAPRGTILEKRPTFILRFPPGLEDCQITLHGMMGMGPKEIAKFDAVAGENPYPEEAMDIQPGVIAWFDLVAGGKEISRDFVVASETTARKVEVFRGAMAPFDGDAASRAVATAAFLTENKLYLEALRTLADGGKEVQGIIHHLLANRLKLSQEGATGLRERLGLGP